MYMIRKLAYFIPVPLILVGAGLAFDHRFVPLSAVFNKPLFVILIYSPTAFFAVFTVFKLRRGRVWSLTAFAAGLIGTGLFHQLVAAQSYGNPGHMVPTGHLIAPVFSSAAYLVAFIAAWAVGKALEGNKAPKEQEGKYADGE